MENCPDCQAWTQAAEMAAFDVAYFCYDKQTAKPQLYLLMNDVFAIASADGEPVPWGSIQDVYTLWKAGGWQALVTWVARRRGVEPLPERNK